MMMMLIDDYNDDGDANDEVACENRRIFLSLLSPERKGRVFAQVKTKPEKGI